MLFAYPSSLPKPTQAAAALQANLAVHAPLVPLTLATALTAGKAGLSNAVAQDKWSVVPQEKRLAHMADALSLGYIHSLQPKGPAKLSYANAARGQGVEGHDPRPHYVLLFDFDHTLSMEDSGEKLAAQNNVAEPTRIFARMKQEDASVRPGGELAAALAHAPEFAHIRHQDVVDAGHGVALKANVGHVFRTLGRDHENYRLSLFVLSAGPTETIRTALAGVVPPEQVQGTRMVFGANNHKQVQHVTAGQGKADFIDALLLALNVPAHNLLFAGDGSSDEVAFRYSKERCGFNILVKRNPTLLPLSHAQVYGNDLGPIVDVVHRHLNAMQAQKRS